MSVRERIAESTHDTNVLASFMDDSKRWGLLRINGFEQVNKKLDELFSVDLREAENFIEGGGDPSLAAARLFNSMVDRMREFSDFGAMSNTSKRKLNEIIESSIFLTYDEIIHI